MIRCPLPLHLVSEANAHEHWRVRQRRAKAQRAAVSLSMSAEIRARTSGGLLYGAKLLQHPRELLPCVVTITRIAPRSLDDDNLVGSAKHVRDGVADALGIDDRSPLVQWRYAQRRGKPREFAVEITLEPAS